jgi:endonuclease/exonuclease/phosphatase family metal-dependent hydrolase
MLVLGLGCEAPSVRECIERSDPDLLDLELVDPDTGRLLPEYPANLRILTINIGNGQLHGVDPNLRPYALRIHHQAYEDHLASRIQALRPAIVGLQEVLPRHTCLRAGLAWEDEPERTCFDPLGRDDAARRLLGPDYSIVCDSDASVDCLAVHVEFGEILGLPLGGYEPVWPASSGPPPGFRTCDYIANECQTKAAECDAESSLLWADVATVFGERIRVVHIHPSAIGDACRETQLEQAFGHATEPWASETPEQPVHTLMLGDWNMDPERLGQPVEELLYYAHIGPTRRLREHDERDHGCARVKTSPSNFATVDRVVSDFAKGRCRVFHDEQSSLGCAVPLGRFDAGFSLATLAGEDLDDAMDHRGVVCDLLWPNVDALAPLSDPLACE